jgi:hypothetical protein
MFDSTGIWIGINVALSIRLCCADQDHFREPDSAPETTMVIREQLESAALKLHRMRDKIEI